MWLNRETFCSIHWQKPHTYTMLKTHAARIVLLLLLFLSLTRAQEEEESVQSYILDLSDTNFTEYIKEEGEWLVEL